MVRIIVMIFRYVAGLLLTYLILKGSYDILLSYSHMESVVWVRNFFLRFSFVVTVAGIFYVYKLVVGI